MEDIKNEEIVNDEEVKTYTQEELDELLQKETDKRVSNAIKKREEKLKQEMKEQIEKERADAESLAKLDAKDRENELLERAKKDIEEREKAIKYKELLSDTKDVLYEEGLPVTFANILVKEDPTSTHESIKAFKTEWQKAIDNAVTEKLKGSTPTRGGSNTTIKNPFAKGKDFNLTEQARIIRENPILAEQLRKQANN